ncbi:MAG: hypothetical protein OIN88_03025 [Candidatus Methanoperedens sp.]|nr:hypothetical protein [Candidatus Methanoperedens sp.]MCZ7360625.1 hypothetical protein [Candidatus Methanoperedens sp.]HLB71956.1 metal-dependent hydrolase [Candidatus Methanoperedens sp.]
MPNWAIHLIVPLLALLITGKKEDYKYILLLLPLAILPDLDTFVTQHRALLHNIFIPLILLASGWIIREKRTLFVIAAIYTGSHVILDMFSGGVVLFYPLYDKITYVDISLRMSQANDLIWTFDYGFAEYGKNWMNAYGYITDSAGTGAMAFILLAVICAVYRNRIMGHE